MTATEAGDVCTCGHPAEAHKLVKGFECRPGVTIDGHSVIPDVWVCSGERLVTDPESAHPWDVVCGCVLHDEPGPDHHKEEARQ